MSDPILMIPNHHSSACGDPPIINGDDPAVYIGYFENSYGEQWIFTYDRVASRGELRGGDAGWNAVHSVENGKAIWLQLAPDEAAWLQVCWWAAVPKGG